MATREFLGTREKEKENVPPHGKRFVETPATALLSPTGAHPQRQSLRRGQTSAPWELLSPKSSPVKPRSPAGASKLWSPSSPAEQARE